MYAFIIIIHIIACLILIASILLQSGRGGGLAGLFSAGTSQTIFGARASTFLTRTTTAAAVAFLLTCISLTVFSSRKARSLMGNVKETGVIETTSPETSAEQTPEEAREEGPAGSETKPQEAQE
jgi:preprotein translocase subunit SecG